MSGDYVSVGGISADILIDTGDMDASLERVRQGLDKVHAEIGQLQGGLQAGGVLTRALDDQLKHLTATEQGLIAAERQLTAAMGGANAAIQANATATTQLNTGMASVRSGGQNMGMAMMQVGAIMDDVQFGLMGVVNNIQPLVMGLTGSAGIAAAAQIAVVGAYQLYKHWDDLQDLMGQGIPSPALEGLKAIGAAVKDVDKAIEELQKKSRLDLSEFVKLEQLRARSKALGEADDREKAIKGMEGPTREDRERASAFEEAVKSQGGPRPVREALEEEYRARAETEGRNLDAEEARQKLKDVGFKPEDIGVKDLGGLGATLGVKFDAQRMQETADAGGGSIGDQVVAALRKEKFLPDAASGQLVTPGQMAARQMDRAGVQGNREAAEEIGGILDERLGDLANFKPSKFSEEFNANSPEGKESQKFGEREAKANEKRLAKEAKEADDLADAELDRAFDSGQEQKRIRQLNARRRKTNLQDSRKAAGGVDELAESAIMQSRLSGGQIPMSAVMDGIHDYLIANGRTESQAGAATEDIVKEASTKVDEKVMKEMLDGPEQQRQEKRKSSEVFDMGDLASRVQSSVGGNDIPQKQLKASEQAVQLLAQIAANRGVMVRVKK